jgi:hypothetical protein
MQSIFETRDLDEFADCAYSSSGTLKLERR